MVLDPDERIVTDAFSLSGITIFSSWAGTVTRDRRLVVHRGGRRLIDVGIASLRQSFRKGLMHV